MTTHACAACAGGGRRWRGRPPAPPALPARLRLAHPGGEIAQLHSPPMPPAAAIARQHLAGESDANIHNTLAMACRASATPVPLLSRRTIGRICGAAERAATALAGLRGSRAWRRGLGRWANLHRGDMRRRPATRQAHSEAAGRRVTLPQQRDGLGTCLFPFWSSVSHPTGCGRGHPAGRGHGGGGGGGGGRSLGGRRPRRACSCRQLQQHPPTQARGAASLAHQSNIYRRSPAPCRAWHGACAHAPPARPRRYSALSPMTSEGCDCSSSSSSYSSCGWGRGRGELSRRVGVAWGCALPPTSTGQGPQAAPGAGGASPPTRPRRPPP